MKARCLNAIICLIVLVFFCILACDNGSVSDSSASKASGLVNVSLTLDSDNSEIQKSISVDSEIANLTYFYKAIPKWDQDKPVSGDTTGKGDANGFVQIPNYNPSSPVPVSLGYFTAGQWEFTIEIRNDNTVLYRGSSDENIYHSNVSINVIVNKVSEQVSGSVSVSVTAPTVQGDSLIISYTGLTKGEPPVEVSGGYTIATDDNEHVSRSNGISTFEYSFSDPPLAAGTYTFTLKHNFTGSGAAVAIDLRQGERVNITGHLDNGVWQVGYITVKVHTIDSTDPQRVQRCTINKNVDTAAAGDRVSFYVIPYAGSILHDDITVTYGSNPEKEVGSLTYEGGLYTFIMPDADVKINAIYTGVSEDILIPHFKAIFKILYDSSVQIFERANALPASGDLFKIKYMTMWKAGNKIYWHSDRQTVKFAAGLLDNMFKDCTTLTEVDFTGFDTSEVTSMAHMFDGCVALQSVDLTGCSTENVEDMSYMFYKAGYDYIPWSGKRNNQIIKELNSNYLSITGMDGFNTEKVTNMEYMFSICSAKTLDVSSFDASRVTKFSHMFAGEWKDNYSLFKPVKVSALTLSGWKVGGNVGDNWIDMSNMFDMANMIDSIELTSGDNAWNFARVINMKEMFNRCESAEKIVFPAYTNLANVTTLLSLFNRDQKIPLTGPGSFTDIFSRWDISGNDYRDGPGSQNPPIGGGIEFTASPTGYGTGDSPNRIMQDAAVLKNLQSVQFATYTPNIKVEIGSKDNTLAIGNQRLKKVVIQNQQ